MATHTGTHHDTHVTAPTESGERVPELVETTLGTRGARETSLREEPRVSLDSS